METAVVVDVEIAAAAAAFDAGTVAVVEVAAKAWGAGMISAAAAEAVASTLTGICCPAGSGYVDSVDVGCAHHRVGRSGCCVHRTAGHRRHHRSHGSLHHRMASAAVGN